MTLIIAQLTESVGVLEAFKPYGLAGMVIMFFMGRDVWKDARDAKRDDKRNEERDQLWKQILQGLDQNTKAIGFLIRATTAEVQSRPHVVQRVKDDMADINRSIDGQQ